MTPEKRSVSRDKNFMSAQDHAVLIALKRFKGEMPEGGLENETFTEGDAIKARVADVLNRISTGDPFGNFPSRTDSKLTLEEWAVWIAMERFGGDMQQYISATTEHKAQGNRNPLILNPLNERDNEPLDSAVVNKLTDMHLEKMSA